MNTDERRPLIEPCGNPFMPRADQFATCAHTLEYVARGERHCKGCGEYLGAAVVLPEGKPER